MKSFLYILKCSDDSYYVGSTNNLELRMEQHNSGFGSIYTKERLPVTLVYVEEFESINEAYYREKQVQGWSRKKRKALINNKFDELPKLSMAYKDLREDS